MGKRSRSWPWVAAIVVVGTLSAVLLEASTASAKKKDEDVEAAEVDYVELAALLLRDGHVERAEATLRQVDLNQEGVDKVRFYSLRGLLRLKQKLFEKARDDFKKAFQVGTPDAVVHVYLAQAYYGTEQFELCVQQLQKAGEAATKLPAAMLMWSEAYFKQDNIARGFAVLEKARADHPADRSIERTLIFRLVDAGLYQQAIELGEKYLQGANDPADFVALGEALRRGGQHHQAQELLEMCRLRFPNDEKSVLALTHVYVDAGKPLAGALLLERVARFDADLALETAELYRRASRLERALQWNARVPDQQEKLRQRLSVLVEMERFEMVAGMEPRLSRLGLLEEENVRYALAYGLFKLGEFDAAEKQLRKLKSSAMFERANQLRVAMQSCKERGWECI